MVAGGAKMNDPESFFWVIHNAIRAGVLGVAYGRNIFQAEDPSRLVVALKSIIHEGATPNQAMEVLQGYDMYKYSYRLPIELVRV